MTINSDLLQQYKDEITKANKFLPHQQGYLDHYKQADLIVRKIKTEIVKQVYKVIESQLDVIDSSIRIQKIATYA